MRVPFLSVNLSGPQFPFTYGLTPTYVVLINLLKDRDNPSALSPNQFAHLSLSYDIDGVKLRPEFGHWAQCGSKR